MDHRTAKQAKGVFLPPNARLASTGALPILCAMLDTMKTWRTRLRCFAII
jgi:hypothetical protein